MGELEASPTFSGRIGGRHLAATAGTAELIAEAKRLIREGEMAHEQLQGGTTVEQHPGTAKPMVTAEQYARGREVLEALPPGVYLKCSGCKLWWANSDVKYMQVSGNPAYLCERCA